MTSPGPSSAPPADGTLAAFNAELVAGYGAA
jgi:hypothetical protein